MANLIKELRESATARWYMATCGAEAAFGTATGTAAAARATQAWVRREKYYLAVMSELAAIAAGDGGPVDLSGAQLDRNALVSAAGNKSTSTLYHLVGKDVSGALLSHLSADGGELAAAVKHKDAVESLVAETKVWNYWPYREGWLGALTKLDVDGRMSAAEALVRVLVDWAASNPALASVAGYAPPAAAAEDFMIIAPGSPAADVIRFLGKVVQRAVGPAGMSPPAVLDSVHDELAVFLTRPDMIFGVLAGELTDAVDEVQSIVPQLPAGERERLSGDLVPQLEELLRLLGEKS